MFSYVYSPHVQALSDAFRSFFSNSFGSDLPSDTRGLNVRQLLFNFFEQPEFLFHYQSLALDVALKLDLNQEALGLQKVPTPRVFRPGDHGTSLHCDYWYGHGQKSFTVWVPLTATDENNTFQMCTLDRNDELYAELSLTKSIKQYPSDLQGCFFPVLPRKSECAVFGSQILHCSERNNSHAERISFDFRIADSNDGTSTKNLNEYFGFSRGRFSARASEFVAKRYIKYICGGVGKSTTAQHILIEQVARQKRLNIVAQEAELERFGHPMLEDYLNGLCTKKSIDGIIIASKSILSTDVLNTVKHRSGIEIYCCLEDEFLSRI